MSLTAPLFRSQLRVDPLSRCAALGLPNHSIAILPFYQSQAELDTIDILNDPSSSATRDVPYSPSFILNFAVQVDPGILTVIDFAFLPGFNNPTLAVLYQTEQTWTGRLNEFKDTTKLVIFTLDLSISTQSYTYTYPVLAKIEGLPHDCMYIIPCTEFLVGGLVVVSGDLIIYIDSTRRVALPVNGWGARISDLPLLALPPALDDNTVGGGAKGDLKLEGSRATFIDDKTLFLVLADGTLYTVEVVAEGKTVTKLIMGSAPLAQTAIPAVIEPLRSTEETHHFFVGSTVGPSVLLKAAHVEEEYDDAGDQGGSAEGQTAVVDQGDGGMDWDDDDDGAYDTTLLRRS